MKLLLHFYRDEHGLPRLFHAHDEHDAQQAAILRWEVPSLVAARQKLHDAGYEGPIAVIMVDTDDKILRGREVDLGPVKGITHEAVDFDKLLPT